jgi:PPOX class probable F420-dependent enzyme
MSRQGATVDDRTRQFLARRRVAHLATADGGGAPHVVPICFTLLGETLYIAIDEKPKTGDLSRLRRLRNIAENPRVAIVADVYDDADWAQLGFVLLRATARVLSPSTMEHSQAIRALREKYPQYRAMALEERPVIAADVDSITGWGQLDH